MNQSLWLPTGYGKGTIIYDRDNNPHEATNHTISGADIYEIVSVDKDYAKSRIAQGAKVLTSSK